MAVNKVNWEQIKAELLIKAQRDLSKLVKIRQARVSKTGKPFFQDVWVLPSHVKATDHVVSGHHNLPPGHPQRNAAPQVSTPAPVPKKVHGNSIPDDAKTKATAWQNKNFSDRDSFLAALKQMGITWNENANAGINFMHAKAALAKKIADGFDPDNPTAMPVTQSAQVVATTPPPKSNVPYDISQVPSTRIKASDASKDAVNKFIEADCNGDKSEFFQKMRQMGVAWRETAHEGTNFMFAKFALAVAMDNGFDVHNPSAGLTPPKDESMLEIPAGATEREKNLIKHINSMTNIDEIQGCSRMGMVPEDERAKQFILDKLQLKLAEAVENPDDEPWFREKDKNGDARFPVELRDSVKTSWGSTVLQSLVDQHKASKNVPYSKSPEGFSKAVVDQLDLYGCKKHSLAPAFELLSRFNMNQIMNPRDYITAVPLDPRRVNVDTRMWDIVRSLNEAYADYTTDAYQPAYSTNLGYTGVDDTIYAQRYDVNKEGFVRGLRKIAEDNPSLKSKVEEMVTTYDEMMRVVDGNPHVLNTILDSPNWSTKPPDYYKVNQFGAKPCQSRGEAAQRVNDADRLSSMVLDELTKRGYSQSSILEALQNTDINDGLNSFRIKNSSGTEDIIDFSQMTGSNGKPLIYITKDVYWGSQLLHYTRAKYQQSQGVAMDNTSSVAMAHYNAAKRLSKISEDDYKKVHQLSIKLAGFKLVHSSGVDLDYSRVNVNYDNWQTYDSHPEMEDTAPEMDAIMANLRIHKLYHDINTEVVKNITRNATGIFNDQGKNYAGNFDYYSGTIMSKAPADTPRMTQSGNDPNGGATYTAQELSDKITQQMNQVSGVSLDYLDKLKAYYAASGRHPKVDSFVRNWGNKVDAYDDSPIKDILYQVTKNVSEHTPATATKPTFQKLTAKRLGYVPFDFSKKHQSPLSKPAQVTSPSPPDPKELKSARAALLAAAKCSLATEPEDVCKAMRKKFAGEDFDYKKGERTPDGEQMLGPIHSLPVGSNKMVSGSTYNQVPLFNSPFFKVNNSLQEENFHKKHEELESSGVPTESYKPLELFQGTSYWSAASIFGQSGGFYMGNEAKKAGKMLGPGAYFGYKAGKSSVYAGDVPYDNISYHGGKNPPEGHADGVIIMADVMRGGNFVKVQKAITDPKYSSISTDSTRDWEMAVRDNALIRPHHFVDVSCRAYGTNVKRDSDGNYIDDKGIITHDKHGKSVTMK